jgi:hypothetical protein
MEAQLYFVDYFKTGHAGSVDLSVGLHSAKDALTHGVTICHAKGYLCFTILSKPVGSSATPSRVSAHRANGQALL